VNEQSTKPIEVQLSRAWLRLAPMAAMRVWMFMEEPF
jgi:hypothetical protein